MPTAQKISDAELMGRRLAARGAALDREDLFLLMESYENTISLNTTLLERQETLNANIERTIEELVGVCKNQARILDEVRQLTGAYQAGTDKIMGAMGAGRLAEVKEHSGHANRIYVALVGMLAIIATLIGVFLKGGK
jgi:predicted nuclease with TOPRIM domain